MQIAALVGSGLGNKGIAQALPIREKTVDTHLSQIYERLGLNFPAAFARWAVLNADYTINDLGNLSNCISGYRERKIEESFVNANSRD